MSIRKKRSFSIFSLSFLDIMSCGFGAVVLVFLIINHSSSQLGEESLQSLHADAEQAEVVLSLRNRKLDELQARSAVTQSSLEELAEDLESISAMIERTRDLLQEAQRQSLAREESLEKLRSDIDRLNEEKRALLLEVADAEKQGRNVVDIQGDGVRQYLTGLRLDGQRVLILLDNSASMLDRTIVNIVRRRNLPDELKQQSEKWQRALRTLRWLIAFLPEGIQFQTYSFNTEAQPLVAGTEGQWLNTGDAEAVSDLLDQANLLVPQDGTDLLKAFSVIRRMSPAPDNIVLLTDGLPTRSGLATSATLVSGSERLGHFSAAIRALPGSIPVNVILFPMEGDPMAASAFWQLAMRTDGSYISPAEDWP